MGSCTRRHFLLSTCFLQMITIIERQVFDFLGYMWAPILVNFFHIIFVIFGFYGAYHFRIKYIITYLIWNFIWIGWNSFLICFYLNVGVLDRDSDLLNLGTGSVSWFEVNSYGCKPTYPTNITSDDPFRPIRPERVDDCLLDYTLVEVIHSGVQCALAVLGILGAILISYIFLDEDDRFDFMNGDAKSPQHTVVHPMYVSYTSIPTSASASASANATLLSNKHHPPSLHQQNHNYHYHQNNTYNHQPNSHQQQHIHQHHNQQPNNNNNTFLIHSNTNNSSNSINKNKSNNPNYSNCGSSNNNNSTPNASKSNTLTRMLYSSKNCNKIASSTSSIIPTTATEIIAQKQQQLQQLQQQQQQQQYYDDSTAKADQLYTNSNRRQLLLASASATAANTYQQHIGTPNSSHDNTTSSLSYASLQNSNLNLAHSMHGGFGMSGGGGLGGGGQCGVGGGVSTSIASPLSNSNYSLNNSINNNNNYSNNNNTSSSSGHFARIHAKPKPPKSTSYSSFINSVGGVDAGVGGIGATDITGSGTNLHRPDIKYTHMSSGGERLSNNLDECFEDDNFSLKNFKNDDDSTYVPFQKPTPSSLFVGQNNNPSYTSLNSYAQQQISPNVSPNNNSIHGGSSQPPPQFAVRDNSQIFTNSSEILLENGAILHPAATALTQDITVLHTIREQQQPILNQANRFLYQQNGLLRHPAYSPATPAYHHLINANSSSQKTPRPTNIPLPTIPTHSFDLPISPSEVTPPPPPAPRPHIFQPRSGHAPYPDLSPEVAEKYAMPTQYVPRSPVASRIARRQRQHQTQHERSHLANTSANFCDQIRDAPPGYIDTGFNIVRAKSHDRLSTQHSGSVRRGGSGGGSEAATGGVGAKDSTAAPHVNRRSGRREGKVRPRSYCNSMTGGEGVIRGNLIYEGGAGGTPEGRGSAGKIVDENMA